MTREKSQDQVLVINGSANVMHIAVKHNDPSKLIILPPDAKLIDAELWAEAEKLPVVQAWMKTVSTAPDVEPGTMMLSVSRGLPALDDGGAEKLLRQVFDLRLLEKFHEDEKRSSVRVLITHRIAEIHRIREAAKAEEAMKKDAAKKTAAT